MPRELAPVAAAPGASWMALLLHRIQGYRLVHLHGRPFATSNQLRAFLRRVAWARLRLVWSLEDGLPSTPSAQFVEDLRQAFRAAYVRIVASAPAAEQLERQYGLAGSTFVIPPSEDAGDGLRIAYETAQEPRATLEDRAAPPRRISRS